MVRAEHPCIIIIFQSKPHTFSGLTPLHLAVEHAKMEKGRKDLKKSLPCTLKVYMLARMLGSSGS